LLLPDIKAIVLMNNKQYFSPVQDFKQLYRLTIIQILKHCSVLFTAVIELFVKAAKFVHRS